MRRLFISLLATFFCFLAADACAKIIIDPPPEVPPDLNARDFKELTATRNVLLEQFYATQQKIDSKERNCKAVEESSPKVNECRAEAQEVKNAVRIYREAVKGFSSMIPSLSHSIQSPDQKSTIKPAGGAQAKPVTPEDQPADAAALAAASQMAAKARADAAYKRYVEKYGDRDVAGRTSAVEKAARGDGYSDEELKAQLQKALLDYRTTYRKNHPNGPDKGVGGSPVEEKMHVGGKG